MYKTITVYFCLYFRQFYLCCFEVNMHTYCKKVGYFLHVSVFVCVEVLRPSQPSGVMSSAVSLPNHTFTGQA